MNDLEVAFWWFFGMLCLVGIAYTVGVQYERVHGNAPECVKPGTTIRPPRVGVTS